MMTTAHCLRASAAAAARLGWDKEKWLRCVQKAWFDQHGRDHAAGAPSRQTDTVVERSWAASQAWDELHQSEAAQ